MTKVVLKHDENLEEFHLANKCGYCTLVIDFHHPVAIRLGFGCHPAGLWL